jgi:hypothetical protein
MAPKRKADLETLAKVDDTIYLEMLEIERLEKFHARSDLFAARKALVTKDLELVDARDALLKLAIENLEVKRLRSREQLKLITAEEDLLKEEKEHHLNLIRHQHGFTGKFGYNPMTGELILNPDKEGSNP